MSKTTLFVGDLHLQVKLILPLVEKAIEEHNVERVIFMGDYVDQWNQCGNSELYLKELTLLTEFREKLVKENKVEPVFLIGNHDMPYLIDIPEYYSVYDRQTFSEVHDLLLRLQPQIAYEVDDYVIASHAGYVQLPGWGIIPKWHFKPWLYSYIDESIELQKQVGRRGGFDTFGSMLWEDFSERLFRAGMKYQIVGHTPQKTVTYLQDDLNQEYNCFCVDTFSLNQFFNPIGDGSMLLYKDNNFEVIENLEWRSGSYDLKRLIHFK